MYHLIADKFYIDDSDFIDNELAKNMLIKLILIKFIPLFTILAGTFLVIRYCVKIIKEKTINWKPFDALELNTLDLILLISGGFVVLGKLFLLFFYNNCRHNYKKYISRDFTIFKNILWISIYGNTASANVYYQIKSIDDEFSFKLDYFQFNYKPIKDSFINGFRGYLMIIPFVLLTSLLMNEFVGSQGGSNPLLEIVLNNNNYFAFALLFLTTTFLAPLFEEIIF